MSKKCKKASKLKNLIKKRARKAANRAKYEAWAKAGENTKSFRGRKRLKKKLINPIDHPDGNCGNIGCAACAA